MTKRGLRGPFGASQRVYLPLPILSLIFSIPFLAEGVGAFLSLGLGLQPIPILPEEVHNSYSKRMDGSGGLAKQHEAHTACLLSCAVETDSRKRCAWSPDSGAGLDSQPLCLCSAQRDSHLLISLSLRKGEVGKCPLSKNT